MRHQCSGADAPDFERAVAGRSDGLSRRALPAAGRGVHRRRAGDRLCRRHHGAIRLRHHAAQRRRRNQDGPLLPDSRRTPADWFSGPDGLLRPAHFSRYYDGPFRRLPGRQPQGDRPRPVHHLPASLRGDLHPDSGRHHRRHRPGAKGNRMTMNAVPISWFLTLSAILFALGVAGFLFRRNIITVFMSIELMLNAVNLSFVTFSYPVSYTHLRAHETDSYLVCRLLLEKKKKNKKI